jgi:hypothetical protein
MIEGSLHPPAFLWRKIISGHPAATSSSMAKLCSPLTVNTALFANPLVFDD